MTRLPKKLARGGLPSRPITLGAFCFDPLPPCHLGIVGGAWSGPNFECNRYPTIHSRAPRRKATPSSPLVSNRFPCSRAAMVSVPQLPTPEQVAVSGDLIYECGGRR